MILYGAGGHALVVKDSVTAAGGEVDFFLDDAADLTQFAGLEVQRPDSFETGQEVVVCIGDCQARRQVAMQLMAKAVRFPVVVHPTAVIAPDVIIGEGTVVMPGAIINSGARIGRHCIVNSGAVVEHECLLGDFVHISPHATLCGRAVIGESTWIGAGAVVVQCISVGAGTVVGAGSVVTRDMPSDVVAYGNPCRIQQDKNGAKG